MGVEVTRPLRGLDDGVLGVGFEEGEVLRVLGRRSLPEGGGELVELPEPDGGGDLREKEMKAAVEDEVVPEWCFPAKKEAIVDELG